MPVRCATLALICLTTFFVFASVSVAEQAANPVVVIETSMGDITAELFKARAPVSVVNFLTYAQDGYYDGTIFHRVIADVMIQGGAVTEDMQSKPGARGPILNEAMNHLENRRGTLAMARSQEINSARSQFFINTSNNRRLDHRNATTAGYGYAVFGRVIDGMDVVDRIRRVRTTRKGQFQDVPAEPVVIKTVRMKNS